MAGILLITAAGCAQQPVVPPTPVPTRDLVFEQSLEKQLSGINPDAVAVFHQATNALDDADYKTAQQLYEQVIAMAPEFSAAYRRLAYAEIYQSNDNIDHAIELLRKAMELEPDAYNKSALALMLANKKTPAANQEAYTLASSAVEMMPDDETANMALLYSAIDVNNIAGIRQADKNLLRVAPYNPMGHYIAGLLAADDKRWEKAEAELLYSKALGMDAAIVQHALNNQIAMYALFMRFLRWGTIALVVWMLGLGLLYLVGNLLSRATIRSLEKMEPTIGAQLQPAERTIRSIYRSVIVILSLYFYISIPFAVLALLLFVGGLFYLFFMIGSIPIQIAGILLIILVVSLFAILRMIFLRRKDLPPGRLLSRTDTPELWALVEQVARKLDTRPVDRIYINPYTEIAVNEKGGLLKKLRGASQRNLILGMGVLPAMTQGQFASVLAHEYGHFYNRDTAGGNLIYQVYAMLNQMAFGLAKGGAAHVFNPVWLFVIPYQKIFLRVTLGASRLQEILADRHAAMAYGRTNSVEGLQNIVRQTIAFQMHANYEVRRSFELNQPISNIYRLPMQERLQGDLEKTFDTTMKHKTSPYDSHPAMQDRIALIERMRIPYMLDQENPAPVLDLFPNIDELQVQMTMELMKNVRRK
jgi:Zn-dependent protease with chaperone function